MAEKLSDDQLRKELLAYGEKSVGPIVASTRAIYVKKLNHHRARERSRTRASNNKLPSKKLIGFSSDESDDDKKASGSKVSGTRQRRKTTTTAPATNRTTRANKSSKTEPPRLPFRATRSNTSLRPDTSTQNDSRVSVKSNAAQTSFLSFDDTVDGDDDDLALSEDALSGWRPCDSSDSDSFELPSNSSKTRPSTRLNTRRHPTNNSQYGYPTRSQSALNCNYSDTTKTSRMNSQRPTVPLLPTHPLPTDKSSHDPYSNWSHIISMLLLVLAGLFFASLAFMYMNMGVPSNETSANYLLCAEESKQDKNSPCFSQKEITSASPVLHTIIDIVSKRAGDFLCGYSTTGPSMTVAEALKEAKVQLGNTVTQKNMDVVLELIGKNPQWDVRLLSESGEEVTDSSEVHSLLSLNPDKSLWCRLQRSFSQVFYILVLALAVVVIAAVIVALLRYKWRRQEEQLKELYGLVEKIIDTVRSHYECYQREEDRRGAQPYLAIPHVRDMLLPLANRRKNQQLWDKAVKFVSANESRIREEIQIIAGEEFCVWRWLPQTCTNGSKVWQGQAFSPTSNSANVPQYTPTQCLKVRNMFDADIEFGEDWHIAVQDAVLEKCGPNHNITHIAVDKASKEGCVYVKCVSPEAAGQVYKALHGSYFDSVLVTVKFIRLERYYERFPDAQYAVLPLRPSNNEKRSLSLPTCASLIESS